MELKLNQLSFLDALGFDQHYKTPTRRKAFCQKLDTSIPWKKLEAILEHHWAVSRTGRPAFPLRTMLRIHILQISYNLSDPAMEDELRESLSFREFVGIPLGEKVPDETTILRFRHFLEERKLSEEIFNAYKQDLKDEGLILKQGSIVDATFIDAPSSTKNKKKERDPEMRSGKKANTWHFGAKMHVAADLETGLIKNISVTSANVADITQATGLLDPEDELLMGDAGYLGLEKREEFQDKVGKVDCSIALRPGKLKKLNEEDRQKAKNLSGIRAKVEHCFYYIKIFFGFRKTPYKGLAKLTNRLYMLSFLTNTVIAERMRQKLDRSFKNLRAI